MAEILDEEMCRELERVKREPKGEKDRLKEEGGGGEGRETVRVD